MALRRDPLRDPEPLIRRVYAYVAYRVGDGPDAEDITSETFERALRYRHTYDAAKGEPAAWLIGIASRCINQAFAPQRPTRAEPDDIAAESEFEQDSLRRLTLAAALAQLDQRDRELLALRYGADLTARQIGEILGLRVNAVEVSLHRALAKLRSILASESTTENLRS